MQQTNTEGEEVRAALFIWEETGERERERENKKKKTKKDAKKEDQETGK